MTVIVVEHKDRLTRFGFKYIETLLAMQRRSIEVVNVTENPIEDIITDFVSILYSFFARLYGQRLAKRKTEKIVQDLDAQAEQKQAQEVAEERIKARAMNAYLRASKLAHIPQQIACFVE